MQLIIWSRWIWMIIKYDWTRERKKAQFKINKIGKRKRVAGGVVDFLQDHKCDLATHDHQTNDSMFKV